MRPNRADDSKSFRRSLHIGAHRQRRWFANTYSRTVRFVRQYPIIFIFLVLSLNVAIHLVMTSGVSLPTGLLTASKPVSNRYYLKTGDREPIPSIIRADAEIVEIPTMTTLDMEMGGGFFRKREDVDPPMWDEYSEDGKPRFAFEEKVWNKDHLELFDKGRNMWIRIKYHLNGFSKQITPTVEFKQKEDGTYSLLDRICNTAKRSYAGRNMRLCSRAYAELDQLNREWVKRNPLPVHYIVSVTAIQYFEWQARNSYYWFKKTQPSTSNYTRLLAAEEPDHLMDEIPTFLTKHWNVSVDNYVAYNKPYSILQWVLAGNPVNEDIVGILDVDMCLLEDFTHFGVGVEEGAPLSQTGFMWFPNDNSSFDQLAAEFCNDCKEIDSLAVPTFIHKNDLKEMAQRWLDKTKEIREVTRKGLKGYQNEKELQLSWTPEMYGYIFGASEMGLSHRTRADMQEYTVGGEGPSERKLNRPAIHFSMHMTMADGYKWTKGHENASWYIPPAFEKNEVSMRLSHELRDARDHLPKLNNSYKGYRIRLS